jgi:hypothetical protein
MEHIEKKIEKGDDYFNWRFKTIANHFTYSELVTKEIVYIIIIIIIIINWCLYNIPWKKNNYVTLLKSFPFRKLSTLYIYTYIHTQNYRRTRL